MNTLGLFRSRVVQTVHDGAMQLALRATAAVLGDESKEGVAYVKALSR